MIAQNIQALRTRDSLTQEVLAERLGVSRQTVAKWESGDAVNASIANNIDKRN